MSFDRPIGAQADLNELEYISALHQTCPGRLRADATVTGLDVTRYLKSRYGLVVPDERIRNLVLGLGGGPLLDEQIDLDEIHLDLAQLTTIIITPTIARAAHEWRLKQDTIMSQPTTSEGPGSNIVHSSTVSSYDQMVSSHRQDDREFWRHGFWPFKKRGTDGEDANNKDVENWRHSLRPMPRQMLKLVLKMLVTPLAEEESRSGETKFPRDKDGNFILSPEMLQDLLKAHGEDGRSVDLELIDKMLQLADGSNVLDEATWVRILSSDLDSWQVECEDNPNTTEFADVFHSETFAEARTVFIGSTKTEDDEEHEESMRNVNDTKYSETAKMIETMKGIKTASFIDFVVDNQRSVAFVIFSWVYYVTTSVTYIALIADSPKLQGICDVNFGCTVLQRVWSWLILALLLAFGGAIILIPISYGNSYKSNNWKTALGSMGLTFMWTALFYTLYRLLRSRTIGSDYSQSVVSGRLYDPMTRLCLYAGGLLLVNQARDLIGSLIPSDKIQRSPLLSGLFTPSFIRGASRSKRAATRKVNRLLVNAFRLHPSRNDRPAQEGRRKVLARCTDRSSIRLLETRDDSRSAEKETMLNFVVHQLDSERCGGFLWTWKRIWNTELFADEGVWIQSRLYVIQVAQFFITLFLGVFYFGGINIVADKAAEARAELETISGLPQWVLDFVPTRSEVYRALYPAASIAMIVPLAILQIYIPSTVSTILKLRSGVFPSLHDPLFSKFRVAPDTVSTNVGNGVYAMFGASVLFFAIVALFLFMIIWPTTQKLIKIVGAWFIGLAITIGIKTVLVLTCRMSIYKGFTRVRPRSANIISLLLESWHIGLGGGVMIGRFVQFLLASTFWIGRIDVPFLSDHVRFGGYHFDTAPTNYRKDLLLHDAHRHPYIVRLGTMYLMKLAHGEKFSNPAGACWRNLFVLALMPWLKRYRVEERLNDEEDIGHEAWIRESTMNLFGEVSQAVQTVGQGVKDAVHTAAGMVIDEWPEEETKSAQALEKEKANALLTDMTRLFFDGQTYKKDENGMEEGASPGSGSESNNSS